MSTSSFITHFRTFASTGLLGLALTLCGCADVMLNTVTSRNEGIAQYKAGRYAEASGTFRTILRANPSDYGSCYFLGACLDKMGAHEQAIAKYKATLVLMSDSMLGRTDRVFRLQCLNSLAEAFVASGDRDMRSVLVVGQSTSEVQFLFAKIDRGWGDADAALEAYAQAALLAPKNFDIAKEYGAYLIQLGQNEKAAGELRRAYALNPTDEQVPIWLRQVGVVPGPSLKNEADAAQPTIPVGPIPPLELVFPASDKSSDRSNASTSGARSE